MESILWLELVPKLSVWWFLRAIELPFAYHNTIHHFSRLVLQKRTNSVNKLNTYIRYHKYLFSTLLSCNWHLNLTLCVDQISNSYVSFSECVPCYCHYHFSIGVLLLAILLTVLQVLEFILMMSMKLAFPYIKFFSRDPHTEQKKSWSALIMKCNLL